MSSDNILFIYSIYFNYIQTLTAQINSGVSINFYYDKTVAIETVFVLRLTKLNITTPSSK